MLRLRPSIGTTKARHSSLVRFRRALIEKFEPRFVCAADSVTFVGPLPFVPKVSPDQIWSTTPGLPIVEGKQSYIHPVSYISVGIDEEKLRATLDQAPAEFTEAANSGSVQITLPTPTGDFARFKIASSPIMAPALAAQFPRSKPSAARD